MLLYEEVVEYQICALIEEASKTTDKEIKEKQEEILKKLDNTLKKIAKENIEIEGYGKLTYERLRKIILDKKEQKKFLKALGFSEDYIEKNSNLIVRLLKKDLNVKDVINVFVTNTINEFKKSKLKFSLKVLLLIVLVLFCVVVNTACVKFLMGLVGSKVLGFLLGAIFVAPIVEELYKYISVKLKVGLAGQIIFNIAEASLYIVGMVSIGFNILLAISLRIIPIIMHVLNALRFEKHNIYKKLGDKYADIRAFILNIVLHAYHNIMASFTGFGSLVSIYLNKLALGRKKG